MTNGNELIEKLNAVEERISKFEFFAEFGAYSRKMISVIATVYESAAEEYYWDDLKKRLDKEKRKAANDPTVVLQDMTYHRELKSILTDLKFTFEEYSTWAAFGGSYSEMAIYDINKMPDYNKKMEKVNHSLKRLCEDKIPIEFIEYKEHLRHAASHELELITLLVAKELDC